MMEKTISKWAVGAAVLGMSLPLAGATGTLSVKGQYVDFKAGSNAPMKELTIQGALSKDVPETHRMAVYPDKVFQTLDGIGGAFNENGAEALLSLPKAEQQKVLTALFGENGAAFTFNRLPVAATDFGLDAYSFSEMPEDYDMKHFSFDRERKYMLPFLKGAYGVNPKMTLQSSPWSPPGWMKYSGVMDANTFEKGRLRAEPKVYAAYAKYLAKFVEEYGKEGVHVDYLCIQNEPDSPATFPGCYMPPEQMATLTAGYIKPTFRKQGLDTKLMAGTFRTVGCADHLGILNKDTVKVFDGIGFQYADGPSIKDIQFLYPDMKMIHTECICYHGENTGEQAEKRLAEMAGYINSGVANFCYWNMILNEESSSTWGWKQNSLIKIDRKAKKVIYNPDYNALYLMSRTLRPGDQRIGSYSRMPLVTVKDAKGNIKMLVQNETGKDKPVRITMNGKSCDLVLPPNALCALTVAP